MVDIDGHIQRDPAFREQSKIYSVLGGETPIRVFSGISRGLNMNDVIEELFETGSGGWQAGERLGHFEMQLQDVLQELEDEKLVQSTDDGWQLTSYGQTWRTQLDSAHQEFLGMMDDDLMARSYFEADDGLVFRGEDTLGDLYATLGFNLVADTYPEALPALYILGEGLNDGEVPHEYGEALEHLQSMDLVEDIEQEENREYHPEITEIGQRVYDEIVLDDREVIKNHYRL